MSIEPLKIQCNEGLVTIPALNGAELNTVCQLWDGITASEYLPANNGTGASYILSLSKPVSDHKIIDATLTELKMALDLLARSWPFSCGVSMSTTSYEVVRPAAFEHNAEEVRKAILREKRILGISGSATINFETIAQYPQAPLKTAAAIANAMHTDPALAKLLEYHHHAWTNYFRPGSKKASWFIDLYKIRDFFKKYYGDEESARRQLGISKGDWGDIGKVLNHSDYRHADETGVAPRASEEEIEKLFQISRDAITSFLKLRGLTPWSRPIT